MLRLVSALRQHLQKEWKGEGERCLSQGTALQGISAEQAHLYGLVAWAICWELRRLRACFLSSCSAAGHASRRPVGRNAVSGAVIDSSPGRHHSQPDNLMAPYACRNVFVACSAATAQHAADAAETALAVLASASHNVAIGVLLQVDIG